MKSVPDRPWAALIVSLCLMQLPAGSVRGQSRGEAPCGIYEYVYPYNTEQLSEDHYIVLDCSSDPARGWYYGTSDDFDSAREGYLPGFFVAEMRDLDVAEGRIRFTIRVAEDEYFTRPVPLTYRAAEQVPPGELERWGYTASSDPRHYQGTVYGDSIVVQLDRGERVFARVER